MRGIAGIIHFDEAPVPRDAVRRLIDSMAIRAPDRTSDWNGVFAGLAHLVRNEVPEDSLENQPIIGPAGRFILVTDAILSNRHELTDALGWSATAAAGKADSDFVAAAYEKWGVHCTSHLDGRFALAVWHPRERSLFAAVDPLAFRPFYYSRQGARFTFATTLRGLLSQPGIANALDLRMWAEGFMGLWDLDGPTLYRDITTLPPGHRLYANAASVRIERYWHPEQTAPLRRRSDAEYAEAFRDVFTKSIRGALRSRGATGVMLSGGLDSAAVTAFAGRLLAESGRRLHAFHLVPAEDVPYTGELREYNESAYVRELQRFAPHIDFHFFTQPPQELMSEEELARRFASDCVPSHGLPMRVDANWASLVQQHQIQLMLSGLGGNELVSPQFRASNYLGHLAASGRFGRLLREIGGAHRVYGIGWRALLREAAYGSGWFRPKAAPLPSKLRYLHADVIAGTDIAARFQRLREKFGPAIARDWHGTMARKLRDGMVQNVGVSPSVISSQFAYTAAAPLFDRRLNEFCLAVPPAQQFRAGWDRRLLREATRGLLPDRVRLRTTRGFPQPFDLQTFNRRRSEIVGRLDELFARKYLADYFDVAAIKALIERTSGPSCSPQDRNSAVSVLNWGYFLSWYAAEPKK